MREEQNKRLRSGEGEGRRLYKEMGLVTWEPG